MIRALFWLWLILPACSLHAGLIETHFPGKMEEAVVKEFEAGLSKMMEPRLKDPVPLRIALTVKKDSFFCQLEAIDGDTSTWATLAAAGEEAESKKLLWAPMGPKHKLKASELPPESVASWFDVPRCKPEIVVSLAAWLAAKKNLPLANAKLSHLIQSNAPQRPEVEAWLCAKYTWTKPEAGLTLVETHNLESGADGWLLLTAEAATARLADLDKAARQALKDLDVARGESKGSFGTRKKPPTMKLEVVRDRFARFEKAFKGTATVLTVRLMEKVKEQIESIDADLKILGDNFLRAERSAIDEKYKEAAEVFQLLWQGDPANNGLLLLTAHNFRKAAGIKDAGNRCDAPDLMKKALGYYELLLQQWPRSLSVMNYLGSAHQSLASKDKAKAYYNEVLRLGDKEKDKGNREFAEKSLANIK